MGVCVCVCTHRRRGCLELVQLGLPMQGPELSVATAAAVVLGIVFAAPCDVHPYPFPLDFEGG